MVDRRYGVGSRGRSPSPRRPLPRFGDFDDTRRRRYSPYHGGAKREISPRNIERRDRFDRVSNVRGMRISEYDNRDKGRGLDRGRRSRTRSPPRNERRDGFDRDACPPPDRMAYYGGDGDGGRREYQNVARARRSRTRSPPRNERRDDFDRDAGPPPNRMAYYGGDGDEGRREYQNVARARRSRTRSPPRMERRDDFDRDADLRTDRMSYYDNDGGRKEYRNGTGLGFSTKSYGEESYLGDSNLMKPRSDNILDGLRQSDHLNVTGYRHLPDLYGVGKSEAIRGDSERVEYGNNDRPGLLPVSQYLDNTKPANLEYEGGAKMHSRSYTLARAAVDDISRTKLTGSNGSRLISPVGSRYREDNINNKKVSRPWDELQLERGDGVYRHREGFQFHNGLSPVEITEGIDVYKFNKEDDLVSSRGYLKGDSNYMASSTSSQPKDYVSVSTGISREGFQGYSTPAEFLTSRVIRRESGLTYEPTTFDGYSEKKANVSPTGPDGQRLYLGLPEKRQENPLYTEFGRSEFDTMRPNDIEQRYRDQRFGRNEAPNPTIDESSYGKYRRDTEPWERYPFSGVQSGRDNFDDPGRRQDLDMLGAGSSSLERPIEGYNQYSSVKQEHNAEVGRGDTWSNGERSEILQSKAYEPLAGRYYDDPSDKFSFTDFVEPSDRMFTQKLVSNDGLYENDAGIRVSTDRRGSRNTYDQLDFSNKSKSRKYNWGKTQRASGEMVDYQPSSSRFSSNPSFTPSKSASRDIKNRLGPKSHKLHVSQRLSKKYKVKPSIKKRLGPAPSKKCGTLPWMKKLSSSRKASAQGNSDGTSHDQDADQSGDHLPPAKAEPPEGSVDFKQMMQSAFYKFLKEINETPTKKKKYLQQGKPGSLKCIVCGSTSEEFLDTESLATHAFTSDKFGLRSQHLGLHRALCAIMGWKITTEVPREWHREVMSKAEASALKDDLILWPPVMIIRNCTVHNNVPEERVIVTTEELDAMLKEKGIGNIVKVCHGKPANQSVMLVKFKSTLSGLQEAQKLHQSYVESKHGRDELNLLKKEEGSDGRKSATDILYGYLGHVEDLDKLDFEMKKRCVLRSKKEILSIVDA